MAFTYILSTDIGKIRLITGDKNELEPVFTDEEIRVFLTAEGSVNLGAAAVLEAWATLYSANVDTEKIGDYSYGQKIVDKMLTLAKQLRETDASTPALTWAEMDLSGVEDTTVSEDIE